MASAAARPPAEAADPEFDYYFDPRYEAIERYIQGVVKVRQAIAAGGLGLALLTAGEPGGEAKLLPTPEKERELRDAAVEAAGQLALDFLKPPEADRRLVDQLFELALYLEKDVADLPWQYDPAERWKLLRTSCEAHLLATEFVQLAKYAASSVEQKTAKKKRGRPPADPRKRAADIKLYLDYKASKQTKRQFLRRRNEPHEAGMKQIERGRQAVRRAGKKPCQQ